MEKHLLSVLRSWDELLHREPFSKSRLLRNIQEFNQQLLDKFPLPQYHNSVKFCFDMQKGDIRSLREHFFRKISIISQTVKAAKTRLAEQALDKIPTRSNVFVLDDKDLKHVLSAAIKDKKAKIHTISKLDVQSTKHDVKHLRQAMKSCDLVLLSSSVVNKNKIVDVAGSELIAHTAKSLRVPVYVVTSVLSADFDNVFLDNLKKGNAYELINPELISGIISEVGVSDHETFLNQAKNILIS